MDGCDNYKLSPFFLTHVDLSVTEKKKKKKKKKKESIYIDVTITYYLLFVTYVDLSVTEKKKKKKKKKSMYGCANYTLSPSFS